MSGTRIAFASAFTVLVVLTLTGPVHAQNDALKKADQRLAELNEVTGSQVGYAGSQGQFHRIAKTYLQHGDEAT